MLRIRGGLSAFTAGELEKLKKVYNRSISLNEPMLVHAFEKAQEKDIEHVSYELEKPFSNRLEE